MAADHIHNWHEWHGKIKCCQNSTLWNLICKNEKHSWPKTWYQHQLGPHILILNLIQFKAQLTWQTTLVPNSPVATLAVDDDDNWQQPTWHGKEWALRVSKLTETKWRVRAHWLLSLKIQQMSFLNLRYWLPIDKNSPEQQLTVDKCFWIWWNVLRSAPHIFTSPS